MKKCSPLLVLIFTSIVLKAQLTPEVTSWILQVNGLTGYNGYPANVQQVNYNSTDVYVTCSCIPGYSIGPWAGNPNVPANQNFCFKITRSPQQNNGTLTATGLGHIGLWSNGVSIFNAKDAHSYNNLGVWNQDAYPNEGSSFDACLGHPAPNGEYHLHVNPRCLYDDQDMAHHSPIIGYGFDGFPVYGAYAYANINGTGVITRMKTSYRLRNITQRDTLPDGTPASSVGPAISLQYPLGKYLEDYEFVSGLGDLDVHNGRFCVTPEYPNGIYAYFVSIDSNRNPVYPYTIGPTYYGNIIYADIGPTSGHVTIPGGTTQYNLPSGITETVSRNPFEVFPNPSSGVFFIKAENISESYTAELLDAKGSWVMKNNYSASIGSIDASSLQQGIYLLRITTASGIVSSYHLVKN